MKNWMVAFLLFAALFGTVGCEDGSGGVGLDGFDREGSSGSFRRDTLYAGSVINDTSFVDSVSTYESQKLYLGSFESYDFRIVMRFIIPASAESVTVKRARIEMIPSGHYGTGTQLEAVVKPIRRAWTEPDVLWTRFETPDVVGDPFSQVPVAKSDTGGAHTVISIPIDTVQNWVWAITDTNRKNYGLMMDYAPGADFVQQFFSAQTKGSDSKPDPSKAPRLVFAFDKFDAGELVEDSLTLYPTLTRNGYLGSTTYNQGVHGYLYRDRNPQDAGTLTVGSGVVYHSFLRWDMTEIPHNATITSASLIMTLDPAGSYQYSPSDSVAIQVLRLQVDPDHWKAGEVLTSTADILALQTTAALRSRWTDIVSDDTLKVSIGAFVQAWITNPETNHGIKLFHGYELDGQNRLYRVRFRRDAGDSLSAPRLAIYYTVPPEQ